MAEIHTYLQINTNCNQKCVFCNRPPINYNPRVYSLTEVGKEIRKLRRNKDITRIILTGGEPTLHPQLAEIIKEGKKSGFGVEIQTNGTTFAKKELAVWKKAGLNIINFAFHSHKEKISNKLRGVNYGFEKIIENIHAARDQGFEIHLVHVINSLNYKSMPVFVDFVHSLKLKNFYLNLSLVVPDGWAWENRWIIPKSADIGPYLRRACEKCVEYDIRFDISEIVPLCLVKGFESHAVSTNFRLKGLNILDDYYQGERILDFSDPGEEMAAKASQCVKCTMNSICGGFYPKLKQLYGTADYKPRRDSLKKVIEKFNHDPQK